jgi:hypothetical protein
MIATKQHKTAVTITIRIALAAKGETVITMGFKVKLRMVRSRPGRRLPKPLRPGSG